MNQYMEAIFDFTKVIELDHKNADAYYGRGIADAFLGKTEEAKKDLKNAVELNPELEEQVKMMSEHFKLGL